MGATIDLNIVSKKNIRIEQIIKLLTNKFKLNIEINNIDIMDNWEYEHVMNIFEVNKVQKYIEESKIANIEFFVSNKCNAGCQIQKIDNVYETNIWIDTTNFGYLDCDIINDENKSFYDKVINLVLDSVKEYDIVISSLGVETIFEYSDDICEVIDESENIIVWIITGNSPKTINNYYLKENVELDTRIFIKTNTQ
ncbi:hypothetical protein FC789_05710 [Clostridium botulinum]|uniref:hypothetical protein n=1 Tax=Clostridium sp. ZBS12 TaxID=2949972 RepID=UPI0013F05195|nr:hypothetical protein [Clostridium sp. ZBS12]NFG40692.1 hypothetical protein [Clostridium botulinum]